jgi:hypothetical protein
MQPRLRGKIFIFHGKRKGKFYRKSAKNIQRKIKAPMADLLAFVIQYTYSQIRFYTTRLPNGAVALLIMVVQQHTETEPEFLNLLRSPEIDSQPGGRVR